jgi:phosphodiesterase/alkaline phosphatase D-like protein
MNFTMQRLAFSTVLFFAVGVGLAEAQSAATPQLGNGSRNGWVDQNSIVIWTRTTQNDALDNHQNGKRLHRPVETQ